MITEVETSIAAKWWADQLRKDAANTNNGDAFQSPLLAVRAVSAKRPTSEQCDQFEQALKDMLNRMVQDRNYIHFGTDYDPDYRLQPILDQVGLTARGLLPTKTIMWIEPNKVHVRSGYGAAHTYLLGTETDT